MDSIGTPELLLLFLIWMVVVGGIGAAIGGHRGRAGAGFFLGVFLGPLGWCAALFLPAPVVSKPPKE